MLLKYVVCTEIPDKVRVENSVVMTQQLLIAQDATLFSETKKTVQLQANLLVCCLKKKNRKCARNFSVLKREG